MWNKLVLVMCFGIFALFITSCSYANDEADILNNTVNAVDINVPAVDLGSDYNDSFKSNPGSDNISIYYGERISIDFDCEGLDGDFDEHCNCSVFIDDEFVSFISVLHDVNMYYYDVQDKNFLNSIYPDVGLHNLSIIFEFDTPQKYDVTLERYKKYDDNIYEVLLFHFNVNEDYEAKKRYSFSAALNILKKDKTVHITNISSFATYNNPLFYDVIVDNPNNSFFSIISNASGIINYDSGSGRNNEYDFKDLRHKIKPGIYNLTIVNSYDNTFDTVSFTLFNDIKINTTYKIEDKDVIIDVELWSEFTAPIQFNMYKIINGITYVDYRSITKEILVNGKDHKFNFKICFNNVDNGDYDVVIMDYYNIIDDINFTINYTFINETDIDNRVNENETVNSSDNVENNVSDVYSRGNSDGYGNNTNVTDFNLDLKKNNTNSNSQKSNVNDDFKEVIGSFGDRISGADSISREYDNSYELLKKSASKSSNNIFSNLGILILFLIVFAGGFLNYKRKF